MSEPKAPIEFTQDIQNTPVILTIFFTIITFGIYGPFWFLTRRDQLNALHSPEKLGKGVFIFSIVLYIISLLLLFAS